jgi:integrase
MKPRDQRYEVPAGSPKGLYLVVHRTGAKSWAFRYRYGGRTWKLTYGNYPAISLAAARADAEAAVEDLDKGINPARTKANEDAVKEAEEQAEVMRQESVSAVAEEFIKRALTEKEKRLGNAEGIIRREIIKPWKHRGIADIRKPDVLTALDSIVDRGANVMACRARGMMLRFFDWSKKRGYIDVSPMIDVEKPAPDNKDRDRTLTPEELVEVWNAANGLGYPNGLFIRFLILTGQRRGEVATMQWKHVHLDRAVWTIPGEFTKNGRKHTVPLSSLALEMLKHLPRFTKGDYVWTTTSGDKPINGFSKQKETIDEAIKAKRLESGITDDMDAWVVHDLRRTAVTLMAKDCKVLPHVLTRVINHISETHRDESKVLRKVYDQYGYFDEKRAALQSWAEHVASLTEEKPIKKSKPVRKFKAVTA